MSGCSSGPGTKRASVRRDRGQRRTLGRGPRAYDIHASQKAYRRQPAWRLIAALSTLVAADGN